MAVNVVAVLPVEFFPRSESPGADPASSTYAVGRGPDAGAAHDSVSDVPFTVAVNPVGLLGTRTATAIWFDGALVPALFCAATWR